MSDLEALNDWLDKSESAFSVCGVKFNTSRCEYGVNPDPLPWEKSDTPGDDPDISCFKTTDYGCEFQAGNEYF